MKKSPVKKRLPIRKKLSVRLKITVWFTAASIVVVLFAYLAVFAVSRQILIKTIQDCLVQAVENNVDEVEYLLPSSQALKEQRYDYLIRHGSGYLDIDDDFLYEVNEVYTGLYDEHSGLLYGSDSAFSIVSGMRFEDSRIQKLRSDGTWYYVFDRKLSGNGLDDLWLRGMVSEEQGGAADVRDDPGCCDSSATLGCDGVCWRISDRRTCIETSPENFVDSKTDQ